MFNIRKDVYMWEVILYLLRSGGEGKYIHVSVVGTI